ncbi:DUF4113 domain-containing protein [Candidatus Kaiserbacteria bacterium]|nr:DUF4113 domain-containing protein [Candidatus Kaiserbacteria bacterium]
MTKEQHIGVLDCNNFFVSCERVFRPDLWRKPVVVLSSNDGCVVARSKEVKDIGIPMGVPYFQIKDILQKEKVTVFSSHFALYRDISRRVFEVLRTELDQIEQYSIDEAFFVIPDEQDPVELGQRLKDKVARLVGVPVSVGVGKSKTQAKAAVERAKQGSGVFVWSESSWQLATRELPLASIWGVGAQLELRYKHHGLVTVADLLAADSARIDKLFGIGGLRLQQELAGCQMSAVTNRAIRQQSVMSSRSFRSSTQDPSVLEDAVAYHVRHVAETLRSMAVGACEIRVFIRPSRHGDYVLRGGSAVAVLPEPTNDTFILLRTATDLLHQLYQAGVPYKKAGVVVSHLQTDPERQDTLFPSESSRRAALLSVVDAINSKAGKETVTIGNRFKANVWGAKLDARSPAYTTRWSDIVSVRT